MTDSLNTLLDSFLNLMNSLPLLLALAAFLCSAFAAILGQGGGLILMTILVGHFPTHVLIPIHAAIQASSNGSRAFLAIPHIKWSIILPVIAGVIVGALIITPMIPFINWQWLQAIIALFILWMTWGKSITLSKKFKGALPSLGLLQGTLGMALGATGPLGNALLLKFGLNKHQLVASNAVIMFTSHVMKILLFSLIGAQLFLYWQSILILCIASVLGSVAGSPLRDKLPEKYFFPLFKITLTLLALRMLINAA